jgi:heme/copper-type cytochrome/quinol oxidase subunit 4
MKSNRKIKEFRNDRKAYIKVVGALVALLLMIIIGVLVFWEVADSITLDSDAANTSKNETTDMATTVFELLPIIALVVVAAIIIGVIVGFGAGRIV